MNILRRLIRPYLYIRYYFERFTRTGPFGADPPVYLKDPFQPTGNPVKDGLHQFYVKQFHESSCSVASVAGMINTLMARQGKSPEPPVTQQDLLEHVKAAHWKERMSEDGYKGRRGLPLDVLGQVVKASLDTYNIAYLSVETVQTTRHPETIDSSRDLLLSRLKRFEEQGDCLLIAHFDQGCFLPEMHIPHISPVGGFDPDTQSVKMLDVDNTLTSPYQVSFDIFYRGLSTNYNAVFRHYGYAEGGYVFVRME